MLRHTTELESSFTRDNLYQGTVHNLVLENIDLYQSRDLLGVRLMSLRVNTAAGLKE